MTARRIRRAALAPLACLAACASGAAPERVAAPPAAAGPRPPLARAAASAPTEHPAPAPGAEIPLGQRLILSWTDGWSSTRATVRPFLRDGERFRSAGVEHKAVVGRAGLGWGRGLHGSGAPAGRAGPEKREGDGRAPAGAFPLLAGFGAAPPPVPTALPFTLSTASHRCIDDPHSQSYGAILDESVLAPSRRDWRSAERLRRDDMLYRYLIVVDHNPAPAVAGAGSCIFLHVWAGDESTTSGCTAMAQGDLLDLLAFADERTLFVQLPLPELRALAARWNLPQP